MLLFALESGCEGKKLRENSVHYSNRILCVFPVTHILSVALNSLVKPRICLCYMAELSSCFAATLLINKTALLHLLHILYVSMNIALGMIRHIKKRTAMLMIE